MANNRKRGRAGCFEESRVKFIASVHGLLLLTQDSVSIVSLSSGHAADRHGPSWLLVGAILSGSYITDPLATAPDPGVAYVACI